MMPGERQDFNDVQHRADVPLSEVPRVLQPHLDDWESLQQAYRKTPENWSEADALRYEDWLVEYWLTLSWKVALLGDVLLTGKTSEVNPLRDIAYLTIRLDRPWNGIETVGGPITSFIPVGAYQRIAFKGVWEE